MVFSSRYFIFRASQSNSKNLCCFLFLFICLRCCFCDWVDPPPLNRNFEKQVFWFGKQVECRRVRKLSGNFWTSMGGASKWNFTFSCVLVLSSLFIFNIFFVSSFLHYYHQFSISPMAEHGAVLNYFLCAREMAKLHGSLENGENRCSRETTWSRCHFLNSLSPSWKLLLEMM